MIEKVSTDLDFLAREQEVVKFWKKNDIFKKSIQLREGCDSFMFYKGDDDGLKGGFDRDGGVFTLLDKPGFGIEF